MPSPSLRPDLLLLDLYLPDRFGLDLLADLRTLPHPCDAIVITAAKEGDAVRAAVRLGVIDYLLKPFGFPDLRSGSSGTPRSAGSSTAPRCTARTTSTRRSCGPAPRPAAMALPKGMSAETARLAQERAAVERRHAVGHRGGRARRDVAGQRPPLPRALRDDRAGRRAAALRLDGPPRAALPLGGLSVANAPAAGQALDVLALIARRGEPVPAAAIARDLGLPRSSVYHLLAVLVDRGYVRHLPEERRYGLGLAAYELGSAYQRQAPLERMARGVMDRLVDATGHNAHLAVLHGRDVLYVIEQRAPGPAAARHRRGGAAAGRAHGIRPGDARRAAGRAGARALPRPGGARAARRPRPDVDDPAALAAAGRAPARPRRRGRPRDTGARVGRRRRARPQRLPRGGGGGDLPPGRRRRQAAGSSTPCVAAAVQRRAARPR